jgi:branched-chain amino acid transport system permease protein
VTGRRATAALQLAGPVALLLIVGLVGGTVSEARQQDFITALVQATMVIAIYVFVGNSGVLSFGHISFVAIGAFAAGIMTIPATVKPTLLPELYPFIADHAISNIASLLLAVGLGAGFALLVGAPLMRLAGLAAGIATFAVLEITHNVLRFWEKIGPGAKTLSLVPTTTDMQQATIAAIAAALVAWGYGRTRAARQLRASREDPAAALASGIRIHRQRLLAFAISGGLAGLAGGVLVHQLGSITTEQVYLELTFITLAMLVIGGMNSLWGATVGALLISFLDTYLGRAEDGLDVGVGQVTLPDGSSFVVLGVLMVAILVVRPSGLTGGREFGLPRFRRTPPAPPGPPGPPADQGRPSEPVASGR